MKRSLNRSPSEFQPYIRCNRRLFYYDEKEFSIMGNGDLSGTFASKQKEQKKSEGRPILKTCEVVTCNMQISGCWPCSISNYTLHVKHIAEITGQLVLPVELVACNCYTCRWSITVDCIEKILKMMSNIKKIRLDYNQKNTHNWIRSY